MKEFIDYLDDCRKETVMQKVKLGRLASNRPGLFTNGYLAMPISEEDYVKIFDMDWDMAVNYVKSRWGFELIGDLH